MPSVATGLDVCVRDGFAALKGLRVGAIVNPTSVDARFHHLADLLHRSSTVTLGALFGPEHGIRGEAQYMVPVGEVARDRRTHVPVHSLYGSTFASLSPKPEQLAGLDALVFDIQDVGSRYYTYVYTMALAMKAAAQAKLQFYVLDRPPYELHRMAAGVPDTGRPLWDEPAVLDTNGIALSPDGRTMAFLRSEEQTGRNLYARPIDGSEPARPIRATRAEEGSVSFSPDGGFLAYQASESGRLEVYAQSFPGAEERVQLSADGGTDPLWARNGEIFYRRNDEFRVITPRRTGSLDFQEPRTLFSVGLSASNAYETRSFDVTRDGSRILAIRIPPANRSRQIEVITNWTSELPRLAPRGKK